MDKCSSRIRCAVVGVSALLPVGAQDSAFVLLLMLHDSCILPLSLSPPPLPCPDVCRRSFGFVLGLGVTQGTSTVQVYSPAGVLQRSFGSGQLSNPYGVCTNDPYSPSTEDSVVVDVCRVYVCDRSAKALLVFRASGAFEGYIGTGVLEAPYGVTFDPADGAKRFVHKGRGRKCVWSSCA
jgi:hypothetical protein